MKMGFVPCDGTGDSQRQACCTEFTVPEQRVRNAWESKQSNRMDDGKGGLKQRFLKA
jgi:hypothetical protein